MKTQFDKMEDALLAPGKVLWEDFMEPPGISENKLARDLGIATAVL